MSINSNFSWSARMRPIELGNVCGIAATIQLTYFFDAVVHEIYSSPPSGVTEFLQWVEESIAYWLQTMAIGFFVYLAYTILFALVMALPAVVVISYLEIHKIRALWPHCLGAVLLWAVARAVYYLSSVFLKPMLDPKSAEWLSLLGGDGVLGRLHPSMSMTWESAALLVLITICQGAFAGWIYWLIAVKRAGLARQSPQLELIEPTGIPVTGRKLVASAASLAWCAACLYGYYVLTDVLKNRVSGYVLYIVAFVVLGIAILGGMVIDRALKERSSQSGQ